MRSHFLSLTLTQADNRKEKAHPSLHEALVHNTVRILKVVPTIHETSKFHRMATHKESDRLSLGPAVVDEKLSTTKGVV